MSDSINPLGVNRKQYFHDIMYNTNETNNSDIFRSLITKSNHWLDIELFQRSLSNTKQLLVFNLYVSVNFCYKTVVFTSYIEAEKYRTAVFKSCSQYCCVDLWWHLLSNLEILVARL